MMNNVVNTYLMFKAKNVLSYIRILAEEEKKVSMLPKQLNRVIYKYYDLFILSNNELNYEFMKKKTGLDDNKERLTLFYLLIEFDMTSKKELSDQNLYKFYKFIVDSIIIFIEVERDKIQVKEEYSYSKIINKITKDYEHSLDYDYFLLLDNVYHLLEKNYNNSLKIELLFKKNYNTGSYSNNYLKVKNGDNLYLNKFRYKKDSFYQESKKDIDLIAAEYVTELDFINLEMLSLKMLYEGLLGNYKEVFVELSKELFAKKGNTNKLISLLKHNFCKERIIFLVKTSHVEKIEGNINYLRSQGFRFSFIKDTNEITSNIYGNCYMFIPYSPSYKRETKKVVELRYDFILLIEDKEMSSKVNNYKYLVT